MSYQILLLLILAIVAVAFNRWEFEKKRKRRRDYYRNEYLKSDAWERKRYVVLKRDNWRCVYCGAPATQVHHKKYARMNIGREPIKWLVSVCKSCHDSQHH
jgi:5-methylcytosine-specific restriction endonuclease McrA